MENSQSGVRSCSGIYGAYKIRRNKESRKNIEFTPGRQHWAYYA